MIILIPFSLPIHKNQFRQFLVFLLVTIVIFPYFSVSDIVWFMFKNLNGQEKEVRN